MKAYDAYLFDADGTLFDTRELIYHSFCALADAYGRPRPDRAAVDGLIGLVLRPQVEMVLGKLPEDEYERAVEVYRAWQAPRWPAYVRLFPGVSEGLADLSRRGKKLAIVTSRSEKMLFDFMDALGVRGHFHTVVTPADTARHKPCPEPALEALRRLGARAGEAVFIGDAAFDIECGRRAGMDTVLVSWGGMDPAAFPMQPDLIVRTFAELLPDDGSGA